MPDLVLVSPILWRIVGLELVVMLRHVLVEEAFGAEARNILDGPNEHIEQRF